MKTSQTLRFCLILALAATALADTTPLNPPGKLGQVYQPPPFELIDLTALLNSLNLTYDQVTQNLNTPNTSTSTPAGDTSGGNPSTNTKSNPPQNTPDAQPKQSLQSSDSTGGKKGSDGSKSTNNAGVKSSDGSKSTTNTPASPPKTTDNSKTTGATTQTTPPPAYPATQSTDQSNKPTTPQAATTPPKSTNTQSTQTPTTTSTSTKNTQTAASTPTSSASSIPTFGPGPQNKNLPPVIDITKLVVDTPLPTPPPTKTSTSDQQSSSAPSKPASAPQPTPAVPTSTSPSTQTPSTQTKSLSTQTQSTQTQNIQTKSTSTQTAPTVHPEKKPDAPKSLSTDVPSKSNNNPSTPTPSPAVTQLPVTQQPSTPPAIQRPSVPIAQQQQPSIPTQKNINQVYLAPVVSTKTSNVETPLPKTSTPVDTPSNIRQNDRSLLSSSPIYKITPSYKAFSKYFIINNKDAYLPNIQAYLLSNYGNYVSEAELIAGFRLYNPYGDNSLDYQLLLSTNYGTFVAILTYWPDNSNIQLKSLSILNFYIMEIDYSHCQEQDNVKQNCKVCNEGYRNFLGRCQAYDTACIGYISDECGKCGKGERLAYGICQ